MTERIILHYQPDGEEIKTMEFKPDKTGDAYYCQKQSKKGWYYLKADFFNEPFIEVWESREKTLVPSSSVEDLNPQYIEFITVKKCPECEGEKTFMDINDEGLKYEVKVDCQECQDGKVEVVTFFGVFKKSKKESDDDLINKIVNTAAFKNLEPVYYQYHRNQIKKDVAYQDFRNILLKESE